MTVQTIEAFEHEMLEDEALSRLLELGRDQGYVSIDDVLQVVPGEQRQAEKLEEIGFEKAFCIPTKALWQQLSEHIGVCRDEIAGFRDAELLGVCDHIGSAGDELSTEFTPIKYERIDRDDWCTFGRAQCH